MIQGVTCWTMLAIKLCRRVLLFVPVLWLNNRSAESAGVGDAVLYAGGKNSL